MNELERWLAGQARRERRAVFLEETLLGTRFWAYSWYRLRYFFARYAVASLTHAVTVLLLYRYFDQTHFAAVLVAYAVATVVSSFWWGSLEAMRTEVRRLYRLHMPHLIPRAVGGWLSLALQLAVLTAICTIAWLTQDLLRGGTLDPATLYVVAIGVRLSLQFFTRAYHSGIYAIRRVYRPLPAIIGVEFAGIGMTLVLVPLLGAWALPAGAIAGAVVVTGLSLWYSSRSYWFLGIQPIPFITLKGSHLPPRRALRDFLGGGLSYALIAVDALIVLVMFSTERGSAGKTGLFALFFLLAPTVQASFEWAQLMYFDLKRLELRLFRNLKRRFDRHVLRLAVVLGVLFAGVAGLIGLLVYRGSIGDLGWTLVPFFVSISLLASVQIGAYAERAYPALIANAGACLAGYVGVSHFSSDPRVTVMLLAAVALTGFALLLMRRERLESGPDQGLLPPMEWLAGLRTMEEPTRISVARFYADVADDGQSWRRHQVGARIARMLRRRGHAAILFPDLLAWHERGEGGIGEGAVSTLGGGLVRWNGSVQERSGHAAARAAARAGLLGRELAAVAQQTSPPRDAVALRDTFERMFTSAIVYVPDEPIPAGLERLSSEDKRAILADAIVFARELTVKRPRSRFCVTAFCEDGELRVIFVASRRAPRHLRVRWEKTIRRHNLETAISAPAAAARRPARRLAALRPAAART